MNEQRESMLKDFIAQVRKQGLSSFRLEDLLKPNGWAHRVVSETRITSVQLRKIFAEFKNIYRIYSVKKNVDEEIKVRLYRLYPIVHYQRNRGLIPDRFMELIVSILDSLERDFLKNIEITKDFMEALVAYAPR